MDDRHRRGYERLERAAEKDGQQSPPPEDPEAERALIGALLLSPAETVPTVVTLLTHEDFTRCGHQDAFAAIERLHARGEKIDAVTVAGEVLEHSMGPEPSIRAGDLVGMVLAVPTYLNWDAYARRVRYCATARLVLRSAIDMARVAYGPAFVGDEQCATEADLIAAAMAASDPILKRLPSESRVVKAEDVTRRYWDDLDKLLTHDPAVTGYGTGLVDLDKHCALMPGELGFIAAERGVGKSALLDTIFSNVTAVGVPALYASIEMPLRQLTARAVARETGLDVWNLLRGQVNVDDLAKVSAALAVLKERPLHYIEDGLLTTAALDAVLHSMVTRDGIKVVFVDYVQLLADRVESGEQVERMGFISARLRQMARQHNICIVAASQVNAEGRLRWARELENDAFWIVHLERAQGAREAVATMVKNRNGASGEKFPLVFAAEQTTFYNAT